MSNRRVVLTGLGTVNPVAHNVPDFWSGLLSGVSGIRPIQRFDTEGFTSRIGGERRWLPPNRRYVSQGLYLPGKMEEELSTWVAVDTSGSTASTAASGELKCLVNRRNRSNPI